MKIPEQERLVTKMWSGVPPEVFEKAPSTTGLFEQQEISYVGKIIASSVNPKECNFVFAGSATAFREMAALRCARKLLGEPLFMQKVLAVDIAPQLLSVAERRMRLLKQFGVTNKFEVINAPIERVKINSGEETGMAILGVYDLNCLLNESYENNREPVALEEYGGGMKEILGAKTRVLPLTFKHGQFDEGEPIIEYDSSSLNGEFSGVRKNLCAYYEKHKSIVGMRIYISHEDFDRLEQTDLPLFISTWFALDQLSLVLESFDLTSAIHHVGAKKGVVLELKGGNSNREGPSKTCFLAMNNVFGNLATGQIMTDFLSQVQAICTSQ